MATSSQGRNALGQWQQVLAHLRGYLVARTSTSSGSGSGSTTMTNAVYNNTTVPPLTRDHAEPAAVTAALQALHLYLHQVVTGKVLVQQEKMQKKNSNKEQIVEQQLDERITVEDDDGTIHHRSANCLNTSQLPTTHTGADLSSTKVGNYRTASIRRTPALGGTHARSLSPTLRPTVPPTHSSIQIPVLRSSTLSSSLPSSLPSSPSHINMASSSSSSSSSYFVDAATTTGQFGTASAAVQQETDIQRALRVVNSFIPASFAQVPLKFFWTNEQKTSEDRDPSNPKEKTRPTWLNNKRDTISKASIDSRTRYLLRGVGGGDGSNNDGVTLRRLTDLCDHLMAHPDTKGTAVKSKGVRRVLRVLAGTMDSNVAAGARVALGLMGHPGKVTGWGPRVLSIDGGGVRGLVALELLRKLEEATGRPVHQLFDYICGVSTGAIVAVMVGIHRMPLSDCERLYRELSERIFSKTTLLRGATGLVINSSYYDSQAWNTILQENMGTTPLMMTNKDEHTAKVCLVASHAVRTGAKSFLFRNYVHPYRVASHYNGTSRACLWEAVRASAAAPGYFSEFRLGDRLFLDGGILVNNPAAIAVHEARQLWPDEPFQCVVSLGTGRCQPIDSINETANSINWRDRLRSVINSATDTEGVHTILHDLLPGNVYFRFNPYLSEDTGLDEIRPDRVALMMEDTELYARKNASKFAEAAAALTAPKTMYHRAKDWAKEARTVYAFGSD